MATVARFVLPQHATEVGTPTRRVVAVRAHPGNALTPTSVGVEDTTRCSTVSSSALRLLVEILVLRASGRRERVARCIETSGKLWVTEREDPCGQQTGVSRPADADRGNRHPRWHLNDGQQ